MVLDIWLSTTEVLKFAAANSWATLSNEQQGIFYEHHSTDRIAHITAFVTQVMKSGWNKTKELS